MEMNRKILIVAGLMIIAIFLLAWQSSTRQKEIDNILSSHWRESKNDLGKVSVAILYESVTEGMLIGPDRSSGDIIKIFNETNSDLIFRGFWRWNPVPESPHNISPELRDFFSERTGLAPDQIPELIIKSGYSYERLNKTISEIKKESPGLIFVGAIPAQRINRIDRNDMTGRIYGTDETWDMALDPQKWTMEFEGKPFTKEDFQAKFAEFHGWVKPGQVYEHENVEAYFPDITNPEFQEVLLSWSKKQIDSGADAIWIDGMPLTPFFLQITGDPNHQSIRDSFEATNRIIDEIHKYGEQKGKHIYVGSWGMPLKFLEGIPYLPDSIDFVTITPSEREIENRKIDESYTKITNIRNLYGSTPVFAFVDWSVDQSPMVVFSQKLSSQQQREALSMLDGSFAKIGVNFIYPVHGGYMGRGEVTTRLAFGKYRTYDSLAPEFNTYETIKELSQKKEERIKKI